MNTQQDNLRMILRIIEDETGVNVSKLQSNSRNREIVWARYFFCAIAEMYLNWDDRLIYSFIKKDRTTHIHAHKKHNELLGIHDKYYVEIYNQIVGRVSSNIIHVPQEMKTASEIKSIRLLNAGMLIGVDRTAVRC